MSKRLLAAASALLMLGILSMVYLPYYIQQKVASSVAEFDGQLKCLDWSVKGLNRIAIHELCLESQGIKLVVRNTDLLLSLRQLWTSSSKLAVLSQAQVQRLDISVPLDKFYMDTTERKQTSDPLLEQALAVLAEIPFVQLPELSVSQITLRVASSRKERKTKLFENPLLSWSLHNKSSASENRITITSLLDSQQWLKFTQDKKGKLQLAWQLRLGDLYEGVNQLASAEQKERFKPLLKLSGLWQVRLEVDSKHPSPLVSSHAITGLKTQLQLPELSSEVIGVAGDLEFETALNLQQGKREWRVSNISQLPLALTGVTDFASNYLQKVEIPGWQLQNPLCETISLQLPVELLLSDAMVIHSQGALILKSAAQQLEFDDIVADMKGLRLDARLAAQVALQLRQNAAEPGQSMAVSGVISGGLQYQAETVNLNNLVWRFSSEELFRLLPASSNADFGNTWIAGQSNATLSADEWQVVGSYRARIAHPKLTLSSGLEARTEYLELSGDYLHIPESVQMNGTISLPEQLNASFKVAGELPNLYIDAQLQPSDLTRVTSLFNGLPETLKITQGAISVKASGEFQQGQVGPLQVEVVLKGASGAWQNYALSDLTTEFKGRVQSEGKIVSTSNAMQIGNFFVGVDISDISFEYGIENSSNDLLQLTPVIHNVKANLLSGQVKVQQPFYPLAGQGLLNLWVERLSVSELVDLFNQQGLHVSGALSGTIPVLFSEGSVSVSQAKLNAVQPGVIRISDNPAFMSLKSSQKNLASTLSLLENLQYSKLDTTISLQPDGWLELAVKMQGMNVEQQQPINFNPTFSTNLFTGLKALRAGKDISEAIEKRF